MELTMQAAGKKGGKLEVSDVIFSCEYKEALIHQVVTAQLAGERSGNSAQKSRSEVRGGGAKPFRQKGTGRARAGTIRSPLWRTGGVTFARKPRDYSQKVNKKMYRVAMRSILSELYRQERLIIADEFTVTSPRTKELVAKLEEWSLEKVLIITETIDENLYLAARNIPHIDVCDVSAVDPIALVACDKVLMTAPAVKLIEERLV